MDHPEAQGLHFNDYLNVLIRKKNIVLVPLLAVFLSVTIYTLRLPPVYQASATVQVDNEKSTGVLSPQPVWVDYSSLNENWLTTQSKVMKSRPIVEKIVKTLGLQLQGKEDVHVYELLFANWFSEGKKAKFRIRPISVKEDARPKSYSGLFTGPGTFVIYEDGQEMGKGEIGKPFTTPQFSFQMEGTGREGERFEFQIQPVDGVIGAVQGGLLTSPVRNSTLISVVARWKNPEGARDIANALVEEYKESVVSKKSKETSQVLTFVDEQLGSTEKEMNQSEELLKQYKGKEKVVTLDVEVKNALDQVAAYEKDIMTLQSYRRQAEIVLAALRNPSSYSEPEAIFSMGAGLNNDYLKELGKSLNELNSQRAGLIIAMKEEHPKVQQITREIASVKKNIANEVNGLISSLRIKERTLQDNLRKLEARVQKLPTTEKELFDLERVVKVNQGIHSFLLQKKAELGVSKGSILANVHVVDPAFLPGGYSEPNVNRAILLALVIGSLMGIGLAFFMEYLDTTVKTPEQLKSLTDLTYLGSIHHAFSDRNGNGSELKMLDAPYSHVAEAFRTIKTNLLFSSLGESKKLFLVTSSGPQEGKTFVTANLAAALAQSGKRVLVLETDLRNPSMRRIFGGEKSPGLTNLLMNGGVESIGSFARKTPVEKLEFVASGDTPSNPSELLGSEKMDQFLSVIRDRYDYVLFDSPPAYLTSDSLVLAQKTDGIILVARSGKVQKEMLKETIGLFLRLKKKMLGIILNDLQREGRGYYYYKYSYYYGNDGSKVKKKSKVRSSYTKAYPPKNHSLPPAPKSNGSSNFHS